MASRSTGRSLDVGMVQDNTSASEASATEAVRPLGGAMDQPMRSSATSVPTRLGPLRVQTSGSGPPAVLWHSLFVDSATWIRVQQPLAAIRRLLLIDGPAHGGSPPVPRRFTLDESVGAAIDVLDHFGIQEPVDWLGNAWG